MDSTVKRYFQYYGAPVLCAVLVIVSFCLFNSARVLIAAFAIIPLLVFLIKKDKLKLHRIDFVVLCLLLVEFIIGFVNTQGIFSKTYLFGLFFNILIYFTIRIFLRKEKQDALFTNILASFIILLAILSIASFYFFKFNIEYEGFTDLINFKNMFQPLGFLLNDWATILLLSVSFVILAITYSHFNTPWFWLLVVGLAAVLMAILLSFSRGAYLSLLIGMLIFLFVGIIFQIVRIKKLLLILLAAISILVIVALPVKKDVITTTGFSVTTSQVRSTAGRFELWKTAFKLIKKEPIIGIGNGNFPMIANPYLASCEDAFYTGRSTNSYLQLLVEKGIVGFIIWLIFIGGLLFVLIHKIRAKEKNSFPALLIFSVFFAVMFRELTFSTFFGKTQMQLFFFVLAAWIVNQDKNKQSSISIPRWVLPIILSVLFVVLAAFQIRFRISEKKNNLFIDRFQEQDYSGAFNAINSALRYNPNNAQLLANKGFLLNEIQQIDSLKGLANDENPLIYYQKAVRNSPYDPYLHHNLAWLFFKDGDLDSADVHFNKACELSANTALFHVSKGLLLEQNGRSDLSQAEFKKAIRLSPDMLDSEFGKGMKLNHPIEFDRLLDELSDSLSLKIKNNNSPILRSRLAKIILQQGDTIKATSLLEQVSKELPNMDRVWYQLGIISLAQNDTATFLRYMNRAVLLDSRDYLYPLALGDYHYQRNQKRDAIYYYKNALINHANLYTYHLIIAPKWYGYKTLPNDILPQNSLEYIKPYFDTESVCDKLIKLYNSIGEYPEAQLFEQYRNNEITTNRLLKELKQKFK